MSNSKLLLSILGLVLFLFTCSTPEAIVESVVKPPIPDLDPEFENFSLLAEKGTTWEIESGTTITIPPNAFVDAEGNLIQGEVNMKYRELHKAIDIYLSGIPLENGSDQLTTAGTFELRGTKDQKEIFVDTSSFINVKLASFQSGDDYDFYELDEFSGDWQNNGTTPPEVNIERKKLKEKVSRMSPGIRFPLNRKYMAFNYRAILDIYYNNDLTKTGDDELSKKLKKYGLGWNETKVYQKIKWKEQEVHASLMVWKNLSGKTFPEWTKKRFGKIYKIKGNQYQYDVANKDSTQFFSVKLLAVMPLKTLFAFSPEKWKNDYATIMNKINAEQERIKAMAIVYRTIDLSGMGIFNWDKLIKDEEAVLLSASFSTGEEENNSLTEPTMVYISGDNKAVIKFPKSRWSKMNLLPDDNGRIFCLLPNNQIGLYPAAKYRKIKFKDLQKEETPKFHFEMETIEFAANSKEDLEKILGISP